MRAASGHYGAGSQIERRATSIRLPTNQRLALVGAGIAENIARSMESRRRA
jgi:hypothetical protein